MSGSAVSRKLLSLSPFCARLLTFILTRLFPGATHCRVFSSMYPVLSIFNLSMLACNISSSSIASCSSFSVVASCLGSPITVSFLAPFSTVGGGFSSHQLGIKPVPYSRWPRAGFWSFLGWWSLLSCLPLFFLSSYFVFLVFPFPSG